MHIFHILVLLTCLNFVQPLEEYANFETTAESEQQNRAGEDGGVSLELYMSRRAEFLQEEQRRMLGGNLVWESEAEQRVNDILMDYKNREYSEGLDGTNGRHFAGAQHFFHVKHLIEASNVFKIIKILPKGCALHMHDFTTGSVEFVALNLTHWPNLYLCIQPQSDNHLVFRFFEGSPTTQCTLDNSSNWQLVSEFRRDASSFGYVDELFTKAMSLYTQTPELEYRDNNGVWYHFARKIDTVSGVVGYELAMAAYYNQTLQEFYDDNVMYIENRGLLEYVGPAAVYRLDQSELTPRQTLAIYKKVTDEFMQTHSSFWGAKYIITPIRFYPARPKMEEMVQASIELKRDLPKFFAGFDIVAHEDVGMPNIEYIDQLLEASKKGLKFFFHAGETDWHGTKVDDNILDAILLNTTRIAHGTALAGRQYLTKIVLDKKICVEVSPISGQVLRLFEDFRMHPSIPLLKVDSPIVIASDNPGMWRSTGLSHDWYIAFMAMAGQRADLRFLKQLALNSIKCSAMSRKEKKEALEKWNISWTTFLGRVLVNYMHNLYIKGKSYIRNIFEPSDLHLI